MLLFAKQNFHGRTLSVVSASTDPDARRGFGPFIPNVHTIEYNDLGALEAALKVRAAWREQLLALATRADGACIVVTPLH